MEKPLAFLPDMLYNKEISLDSDESDESIMLKVAKGNEEASEELIERYQKPLFAFLYRIVVNEADTEDLFQETWMRVVRYSQTYDSNKKFSTWLFQIAVNCTRDFFAKNHNHIILEEDISVCENPDIKIMENRDTVEMIVKHLPVFQREVLILRYFHDKKEKEIADILNIPIGTVKSRLHSVLEYLKKFYGKYYERTERNMDE